jgi:hypothetical protein
MLGSRFHSDRLARFNMLLSWFLGAFPALLLLCLPETARVVYGEGFSGRNFLITYLLVILCGSIMVYKQGLARVLAAHGLMWWGTASNFAWALTMLLFSWLLVPRGAIGYSIAWLLSYAINTVLFLPLYTRKRLVPKDTIFSAEAALMWLLLIAGTFLGLSGLRFTVRLLALPFLVAGMLLLFRRLFEGSQLPMRTS